MSVFRLISLLHYLNIFSASRQANADIYLRHFRCFTRLWLCIFLFKEIGLFFLFLRVLKHSFVFFSKFRSSCLFFYIDHVRLYYQSAACARSNTSIGNDSKHPTFSCKIIRLVRELIELIGNECRKITEQDRDWTWWQLL